MYRTPPSTTWTLKLTRAPIKRRDTWLQVCMRSLMRGGPQSSTSKKTEQEAEFRDEGTGGPFTSAGCSCLGPKPLLVVTHFYPCSRLWCPDHQPKCCEIISILRAAPLGAPRPSRQHPRINVSSTTFERITDPSHPFFGSGLTERFPAPFILFHLKSSSAHTGRNPVYPFPYLFPTI